MRAVAQRSIAGLFFCVTLGGLPFFALAIEPPPQEVGHGQQPIELRLLEETPGGADGFRSVTVGFESRALPSRPEIYVHMEQVKMEPWDKSWAPYVRALEVRAEKKARKTECCLVLDIAGMLDGHQELPYRMKLQFHSDPYRIRIRGEMLEFPPDKKLTGYYPCLGCKRFSIENDPPFEMARKSFLFFGDGGFKWASDAPRRRAEYHLAEGERPNDEGPWIQLFPVSGSSAARESALQAPLVAWIAGDGSHLVAMASRNASHAGIRWGPCLHSDPLVLADGKSFETFVYILPLDLKLLLSTFGQDFPEEAARLSVSKDALWPFRSGILLDDFESSFEGEILKSWRVEGSIGKWAGLEDWLWVGKNSGEGHPEGVTEGKSAASWEIPSGKGGARLARKIALPAGTAGISHITLDAMHRGDLQNDMNLRLIVSEDGGATAQQSFRLQPRSNRRLVVTMPQPVTEAALTVALEVEKVEHLQRLVLDNLRCF